ncbi:MAG: CCA tRNA nucleotidyltransferase [Synechococcus sp.]
MPAPAAEGSILKAHPARQAQLLRDALAPEQWPVPLAAFPQGSALVGGAVRDGLLGRLSPTPDLDLVVPADALGAARHLAQRYGGACVVLDEQRDMARLVVNGWTIDLARQDGANLSADLQRRDYRINAIALRFSPNPQLIDPCGGLEDLKAGLVTAVAEQNLIDDPLRLLRGIRIAAELNFAIAEDTWPLLINHRDALPQAAPERIQAELTKLVQAPGADRALELLGSSGLLAPWAASPQEHKPGHAFALPLGTTVSRLTPEEQTTALPLVRLTRLLSDNGLQTLRFSRRQIQRCLLLRRWKDADDGDGFRSLPREQRLKLHTDLGTDLPALIVQLSPALQEAWLERWRDPHDPLFHPRQPLDGTTLQQELGIRPGPQLGQLLKHLAVEHAFGHLQNREAALVAARQWLMTEP